MYGKNKYTGQTCVLALINEIPWTKEEYLKNKEKYDSICNNSEELELYYNNPRYGYTLKYCPNIYNGQEVWHDDWNTLPSESEYRKHKKEYDEIAASQGHEDLEKYYARQREYKSRPISYSSTSFCGTSSHSFLCTNKNNL